MTDKNKKFLVVGLGISGMSVVRYLDRIGASFEVVEGNAERCQTLKQQEAVLKNVQCHSLSLIHI